MDGDGMRFVTSDPSQVPKGSADVTPGLLKWLPPGGATPQAQPRAGRRYVS